MTKRNVAALVVCLCMLVGFAVASRYVNVSKILHDSLEWIRSLGIWAPIAFIVLYALACVLAVPASLFTLGGGFLFGFAWGSLYVIVGAMIGAVAAFIVGRYAARDWVAKRIERHQKFKLIDEAIGREGWKIVLLLRLAPVFPYAVLNYGFALTRVSLRHYTFATAIGIIPAMLAFVYFGTLATDLTKLGPPPAAKWAIAGAAVVVGLLLTRFARRALNRALNSPLE